MKITDTDATLFDGAIELLRAVGASALSMFAD
jgi:hypothetical protein